MMKRWLTLVVLASLIAAILPVRSVQSGIQPAKNSSLQDNGPAIYLRGVTIYPEQGQPSFAPGLAQSDPSGEGLHMVQFSGPIQPEWLDGLRSSGLEIVSYLPDYAYLVWGQQPPAQVQQAAGLVSALRWDGPYHPYYRLAPELRELAAAPSPEGDYVDVTVQFYNTHRLKESLERVTQMAQSVIHAPATLRNLTHLRVSLPAQALAEVAAWPDVIAIEPYQQPELLDEAQGMIMAGNVTTAGGKLTPTGPGYLAWLDSKGFPKETSAYPLVDVVDDGIDAGNAEDILHPDFFTQGSKSNADRVLYAINCTSDITGNSVGGHGNLNAGILAGFNNQTAFPYLDADGFHYGLGISPYGPIASSKVFTNQGFFDLSLCGSTVVEMVRQAYQQGAKITSNSWGASVSGTYTVEAQSYDILTRDASTAAGNQEMLHIFAAGNSGPSSQSVGSPGTAKNVLTVGATENVRDHNVIDGCFNAEGDSAGDIAIFSGRGPTTDGRTKPEIVAPGTHVQGPASQDPGFNGTGVCGSGAAGGSASPFYPAGQNLYTWSTGTSHSTPAVAGAAQLVYSYYQRVLAPGKAPSPAMLKALLLNTPRYLSGTGAGDNLPSQNQGWGMADLGAALDDVPRILVDQQHLLTASGDSYRLIGQVQDLSKPFHVSLVWTDAPGSVSAAKAGVNDLNLEVVVNGQTYYGNVFSGAHSVSGGSPDKLNNVESVFLPAGLQGQFQIRVVANNLAGDGVPGNSEEVDQDFALVVYNATEVQAPVFSMTEVQWDEVRGNGNGAIDPGETIEMLLTLKNQGSAAADAFTAVMQSSSPDVAPVTPSVEFPGMAPGETGESQQPFLIKISEDAACDITLPLTVNLNVPSFPDTLSISGLHSGSRVEHEYTSDEVPIDIVDYDSSSMQPGITEVPLNISNEYSISDLNVLVNLTHTWDGDINLTLISPDGVAVTLANKRGAMGDNYEDTLFDDQAETPITSGIPPFSGPHQPEQPLSQLNGNNINGEWTLRVTDSGPGDTGEVLDFNLITTETTCSPYRSTVELVVAQGDNAQNARPENEVLFSVLVINHSDSSDTFDLEVTGDWPVELPSEVGPLNPGQSMPVEVRLTVPAGTSPGENYQALLTAKSQNEPDNLDDVALFVNVVALYWMPVAAN